MRNIKYLIILGEEASCASFSPSGPIGAFLTEEKNKYKAKKVIDLTKPKLTEIEEATQQLLTTGVLGAKRN